MRNFFVVVQCLILVALASSSSNHTTHKGSTATRTPNPLEAQGAWVKVKFFNESGLIVSWTFNTSDYKNECFRLADNLAYTESSDNSTVNLEDTVAKISWYAMCPPGVHCRHVMDGWKLYLWDYPLWWEDGGPYQAIDYLNVVPCEGTICAEDKHAFNMKQVATCKGENCSLWFSLVPTGWRHRVSAAWACPKDLMFICEARSHDSADTALPLRMGVTSSTSSKSAQGCCIQCIMAEDCVSWTWDDVTGSCIFYTEPTNYDNRAEQLPGLVYEWNKVPYFVECLIAVYDSNLQHPLATHMMRASMPGCTSLPVLSSSFSNVIVECNCYYDAKKLSLTCNDALGEGISIVPAIDSGGAVSYDAGSWVNSTLCTDVSCVAVARLQGVTSGFNTVQLCVGGNLPRGSAGAWMELLTTASTGESTFRGPFDITAAEGTNVCWVLEKDYRHTLAAGGQELDIDNMVSQYSWNTTCYGNQPCSSKVADWQLVLFDNYYAAFDRGRVTAINYLDYAQCTYDTCAMTLRTAAVKMANKISAAMVCPKPITTVCGNTRGLDDDMAMRPHMRYSYTPITAAGCCFQCQLYEDCSRILHWDWRDSTCYFSTDYVEMPVDDTAQADCQIVFFGDEGSWDNRDKSLRYNITLFSEHTQVVTLDLEAVHQQLYKQDKLTPYSNVSLLCNCFSHERCHNLLGSSELRLWGGDVNDEAAPFLSISFQEKECTRLTCATRKRLPPHEWPTGVRAVQARMKGGKLEDAEQTVAQCRLQLFEKSAQMGPQLEYTFAVMEYWNASVCMTVAQDFSMTALSKVGSFLWRCDCHGGERCDEGMLLPSYLMFYEKPIDESGDMGQSVLFTYSSAECEEDSCELMDTVTVPGDALYRHIASAVMCFTLNLAGINSSMVPAKEPAAVKIKHQNQPGKRAAQIVEREAVGSADLYMAVRFALEGEAIGKFNATLRRTIVDPLLLALWNTSGLAHQIKFVKQVQSRSSRRNLLEEDSMALDDVMMSASIMHAPARRLSEQHNSSKVVLVYEVQTRPSHVDTMRRVISDSIQSGTLALNLVSLGLNTKATLVNVSDVYSRSQPGKLVFPSVFSRNVTLVYPTPPAPPAPAPSGGSSLNIVAIVVPVVVVAALLLVVIVGIVAYRWRRHRTPHDPMSLSGARSLISRAYKPMHSPADSIYLSDMMQSMAKGSMAGAPLDSMYLSYLVNCSSSDELESGQQSKDLSINSVATSIPASVIHTNNVSAGGGSVIDLDSADSWVIDPAQVEMCIGDDGELVKLGSSTTGSEVFKARYRGDYVAVKVMEHCPSREHHIQRMMREAAQLRKCQHDNIIRFHGTAFGSTHLMLIFEYMQYGTLYHALHMQEGRSHYMWYGRGKDIALGIARGLVYLHGLRISQLDLKSHNVLLDEEQDPKIGDIGLSRAMHKEHPPSLDSTSWAYTSPEAIQGLKLTEKVDIFSFGVILWEIVTGEVPLRGRFRPPRVPEECPQVVADMMHECLHREPGLRPNAGDVYVQMHMAARGRNPNRIALTI